MRQTFDTASLNAMYSSSGMVSETIGHVGMYMLDPKNRKCLSCLENPKQDFAWLPRPTTSLDIDSAFPALNCISAVASLAYAFSFFLCTSFLKPRKVITLSKGECVLAGVLVLSSESSSKTDGLTLGEQKELGAAVHAIKWKFFTVIIDFLHNLISSLAAGCGATVMETTVDTTIPSFMPGKQHSTN